MCHFQAAFAFRHIVSMAKSMAKNVPAGLLAHPATRGMTEAVHSLQLKIDAAAAEAGSKRFTAALSAVKKAVSDLEDGTVEAFVKRYGKRKTKAKG